MKHISCVFLSLLCVLVGCSGGSSSDGNQELPEVIPPGDPRDPKAIYLNPSKEKNLTETMTSKPSFFVNAKPYRMKVVNDDKNKSPIKTIALDGAHGDNYKVQTCLDSSEKSSLAFGDSCDINVLPNAKGVWREEKNETVNLLFTYEDKQTITMAMNFEFKPYYATTLTSENPDDTSNYFGWNIAAIENNEKKFIAVGSPGKSHFLGSTYIFLKNGSDFERKKVSPPENISDEGLKSRFGQNVHLEVVSGKTFLFVSDYSDIDIGEEGVSVTNESVFVYRIDDNGDASYVQTLEKSDEEKPSNFFGHSIAYYEDGKGAGSLFVGAYGNKGIGKVYVYKLNDGKDAFSASPSAILSDPTGQAISGFGYSLALDKNEGVLFVGRRLYSEQGGGVYAYKIKDLASSSKALFQLPSPNDGEADRFAKALKFQNNELFVTANKADAVGQFCVFSIDYNNVKNDPLCVLPPDGDNGENFGGSLDLFNKDFAIIGAYGKKKSPTSGSDNGSVYFYNRIGKGFQYLDNVFSDEGLLGKGNDKVADKTFFGYSIVSVKDSFAVVSADGDGEKPGFVVVLE